MNFLERINIEDVTHAFYYNQDKNRPVLGISGEVILIDGNGNPVPTVPATGAISGGDRTYSTASGDFTASTTNGTKIITLSGLPFPLTLDNLILSDIKKIDSTGLVTSVLTTSIVLTGPNSFRLDDEEANFATGDQVTVAMVGPDKAYDKNQDVIKQERQNPEWDHYTSIEHLVDVTNGTPGTYFIAFEVAAYRNLAIQLNASDAIGAAFVLYATLDENAVVPATDGSAGATWVNMNDMLLGGVIVGTTISELSFIDTSYMPNRYMIQYTIQDATNTVDSWIRKY